MSKEKTIKLSPKQKDLLITLRQTDPIIMKLRDGYWLTGGSGQVDGRTVESLKRKGLINYQNRISALGKTIQL